MKNLFYATLISITIFYSSLNAQWIQTNGRYSGVEAIAISGMNLFAGTYRSGVVLSTDNGATWKPVNSGLSINYIYSLAVSGTKIFAGTTGRGVYISTNNGTIWNAANNGISNTTVLSLAVIGPNTFAGTNGLAGISGGIYLSTNDGTIWNPTLMLAQDSSVYIFAISPNGTGGTNILAGTSAGVLISTNNGTDWNTKNNGLTCLTVEALAISGTNIFAGNGCGVFLSTNSDTIWKAVNNGLNPPVWSLAVSGTNIFAGTSSGIYLSTNNGTNWNNVSNGLTDSTILTFAVSGTDIYAGSWGGSVWRRPLSEMITYIKDIQQIPQRYSLSQNYPNPFNPSTTINYTLQFSGQATLKVFDVLGKEVATLVNEEKPAGNYSVSFNALQRSSGIYFYKLQAGSFVEIRKMLLLK